MQRGLIQPGRYGYSFSLGVAEVIDSVEDLIDALEDCYGGVMPEDYSDDADSVEAVEMALSARLSDLLAENLICISSIAESLRAVSEAADVAHAKSKSLLDELKDLADSGVDD